MTPREKILSLAIRCNILEKLDLLDSNPWRNDTLQELTEFYHAAQREAFEAAAKLCDGFAENGICHTNYPEEAFAGDCAAAIRKMAKEVK